MTEPYEKLYMEHSKGSGNKPSPHTSRIETNTGRGKQRKNSPNQILTT